MFSCGLCGRGAFGACGDSRQNIESSGWVGVFGGDPGRASGCEGLFFTKLGDKEAKRVGEAGGAEGSVGDGALGSTTA